LTLSSEQKKSFFKYQEEKNTKVKKQISEMTTRSVSKKYDSFFGYINDNQKELIKNNLPLLKSLSQKRFERRVKIQKSLKKSTTPDQVQKSFDLFIVSLNENSKLNEQFFNFIKGMIQLTNPDQKKTLREKKLELIQILEYYITNTY
jgi:hypothetical protein